MLELGSYMCCCDVGGCLAVARCGGDVGGPGGGACPVLGLLLT